jgi:hypothetical protein
VLTDVLEDTPATVFDSLKEYEEKNNGKPGCNMVRVDSMSAKKGKDASKECENAEGESKAVIDGEEDHRELAMMQQMITEDVMLFAEAAVAYSLKCFNILRSEEEAPMLQLSQNNAKTIGWILLCGGKVVQFVTCLLAFAFAFKSNSSIPFLLMTCYSQPVVALLLIEC